MIASHRQALLMWFCSWFTLLHSVYAHYFFQFDLSFLSFCVFITSLLYWSEPKNNWIRKLNMFTSFISLLYNIRKSYKNEYYTYLFECTGIIMLYPSSLILYGYKRYWLSIYYYAIMNVLGNLSNMKLCHYLFHKMVSHTIIKN